MCIELQKINLRLLSRYVAILIYALFKESYATKIAVVGKLYVLPALVKKCAHHIGSSLALTVRR